MPAHDDERRLQISLRLKAARWLSGHRDARGRASAMTTADLAACAPLRENGITKNRLEDIEQMRTPNVPRKMELEQIERALDLPSGWFATPAEDDGDVGPRGELRRELEAAQTTPRSQRRSG